MLALEEYFGDWMKVIDKKEFNSILRKAGYLYKIKSLCPEQKDVFKAFNLCKYEDCKCVFIGMDPYNDLYENKPRATGILFGNNKNVIDSKLSPSLKIIKDSCINLHIPHNCIIFDPSLESWAKQGILMLNSSLTVETGKAGSHTMLWRPFISGFLERFSQINTGIVYVLFGNTAHTLKPYIGRYNDVLEIEHPAYYARIHKEMPSELFYRINSILKARYGNIINWYKEI